MALTSDFNPNNPVPFSRMRYLLQESGGGLQAGIVGASDLMVVQRGAGANMSVDVGTGGGWVAITTGTRNGLAHCFNDAVANVSITAAHATLPRIDQIYLRYNDSSIPTGSGDIPTLAVGTGTATSGATLANRTGAIALPADTLRLADVLVAAADTSITNSEIRDRRPWARGAYCRIVRNAGTDYTTTSTTLVVFDPTNLQPRIECSGVPIRVKLKCAAYNLTAANGIDFDVAVDGVNMVQRIALTSAIASARVPVNAAFEFTPAAGSHLIGPSTCASPGGTVTISCSTNYPVELTIEEMVRQNTANNTTTSG